MDMIYFIKGAISGRIKIGKSNDPERRLRALQTGSPEPLELLGTIPGGLKEERILQKKFKRFAMHGEWFKGEPDLVYAIKAILLAPIEELIQSVKGTFWRIMGEMVRGANPAQPVDLFCVHRNRVGGERIDPDEMLSAVCAGARFLTVGREGRLKLCPDQWPLDLESLRVPLTSKAHLVWVADLAGTREFLPVLPDQLRKPLRENLPPHPTDAFAVGSAVTHPEHGVGRVAGLYLRGCERAARIDFVEGESRDLFLCRCAIRLATPEEAVLLEPRPKQPEPWRPAWMNEPRCF